MPSWMMPWLVLVVPFIGAALTLLMSSSLHRMKTSALLTAAAGLLASIWLSWSLTESLTAMPFLCLLPLGAFLSLLGQPLHEDNRMAWVMTLVLLGLGLGILTAHDAARDILVIILFGLLCWLIYRYRNGALSDTWRGLATYGLGMAAVLLSFILPASASAIALLVACATLLPLIPLHGAFVVVLTGLPGNLPAFAVLLLPMLGFHRLLLLLPTLTHSMFQTLAILALVGACYGSLLALIQSRVRPRFAHAGLAFFSMLWWYIADTPTTPVQSVVYLSAVGLAMSGLLLGWYVLRARYGEVDVRALGGLAYPMPRFSTLLALLALAALGMPPFGVFSGFMGMLLSPSFVPSASFVIIMLVWLSSSWYLLEVVQQLVFGRQRSDLQYEDLRRTEFASLLTLLLLLLALGAAPSRLFQSSVTSPLDTLAMKGAHGSSNHHR
jgi:NADH-quinone oxidoreductase subunit M